jgi:hypothetical protein
MFNNQTISPRVEDGSDLKTFKNIIKFQAVQGGNTHNDLSLHGGHFMDSKECGLGD